jgi:DNA polymerase-3 subunit delta
MSKYLIYGQEILAKSQAIEKAKEKFRTKFSAYNIEQIDFEDSDLNIQDLQAKLQTIPFLAKKRLLVIRSLFSAVDEQKEKIIFNQLNQVPESTILILVEGPKLHYSKAKKLKNLGFKIKKYQESKGYQLEKWLEEKARQFEIKINSANVKLIINRLGSDSSIIYQELIKLKNYLDYENRSEVTKEDIEEIVSIKTDLKIFDLMDQVAVRNKAKAIEYLYSMLDEGVSPNYILAMLDSTLTNLLLALDLKESQNSISPDILKEKFGWHPFVAQKIYSQLKNFKKKDLTVTYQKLYEIDIKFKTSNLDPKTELTLFLGQL